MLNSKDEHDCDDNRLTMTIARQSQEWEFLLIMLDYQNQG